MTSEFNTPDDIFTCQLCGQCCQGFGGTYVTEKDIEQISGFIQADPASFVDQYCDMSGSRPVLTTAADGTCIFFHAEKQCTIHLVKPYMCKAWPFIRTILTHPENWDIMANSCPGMVKGVSHEALRRIVAREKEKLDTALGILSSAPKEE